MHSNIDEAGADIAAAIIAAEAAPSDWRVHFELGLAYLIHDMFSEAVAPLERARALDGHQVATHLNLSVALTNSGDGHAGEAAARAAIALDPSSRGYFCLGNALRQQGQPEAAVSMFRKHLELDPLDRLARCNLGLALGHAGHHQDALGEFRTVLLDRPRDFKALDGASIALFELGDYEGAISMLRRACDVDATDTGVWLTLGSCLMRTERFVEALVAFEHVLAIDPDNVGGNYNQVATLINLGRASDAVGHAERALNLGPEHSEVAALLEIARKSVSAEQAQQKRPADPPTDS
jgi:tetratricopeptide (TPR) repeat protein